MEVNELIYKLAEETMQLGENPSVLQVIESRIFFLVKSLYECVNNGDLEGLPNQTMGDALLRDELKLTYNNARKELEPILAQLYKRAEYSNCNILYFSHVLINKKCLNLQKYEEQKCCDLNEFNETILKQGIRDLINYSYSIYHIYHELLFGMLSRIDEVFYEFKSKDELQKLLENSFKVYVIETREITDDQIREKAMSFKEHKSRRLSADDWEKYYAYMELQNEIAIKGVDNCDISRFNNDDIEELHTLEGYPDIIDLVIKGKKGEDLFSFEKLFRNNWKVFEKLNVENLEIFYDRIHLYNMIMCGMYPELKQKYDEYLKIGLQSEEEELDVPYPTTLDQLESSIRAYFLPKDKFAAVVKIMNETILPEVQATGNKANWDYVCYAFKVLGIINKKLSREKVAKLFVAMCPDLDDAANLKTSMEHSGANYLGKYDSYDSLGETNSLKVYTKPYIDALKDIL